MKTNKFGEIVFDEDHLCDLVMRGRDLANLRCVTMDPSVDLQRLVHSIEQPQQILTWKYATDSELSVSEFDALRQQNWFMPQDYQDIDIAQHVLDLCNTQDELQRVGQELLLYQEHDLFDLLKYMKYLVDQMRANGVIWGVGRGSSVASYVLYLLGVHRVNSIYYDLDPREFLR
jgi:hypothetical protein